MWSGNSILTLEFQGFSHTNYRSKQHLFTYPGIVSRVKAYLDVEPSIYQSYSMAMHGKKAAYPGEMYISSR